MFGLMDGVRSYLGWAGLVFMAGSLSFSALGEQEGICVDCVKGDQTQHEIQNLNKLTCEAQLNRPECKNVPDILRPDCNNPPSKSFAAAASCTIVATIGALFPMMKLIFKGTSSVSYLESSKVTAKVAPQSLVRFFPWVTAAVAGVGVGFLAIHYDNQVRKVMREARQRGLDPKDTKAIKKIARQEHAYSVGKRVYDMVYGDRHCYNRAVQDLRACGLMAGVAGVGAVAGGVSMGVMGAAAGSEGLLVIGATAGMVSGGSVAGGVPLAFAAEYEKVRSEVEAKIGESKGSLVPSATESLDQLLNEARQ